MIRDTNSALRKSLSGQMFTALTKLLDRAEQKVARVGLPSMS